VKVVCCPVAPDGRRRRPYALICICVVVLCLRLYPCFSCSICPCICPAAGGYRSEATDVLRRFSNSGIFQAEIAAYCRSLHTCGPAILHPEPTAEKKNKLEFAVCRRCRACGSHAQAQRLSVRCSGYTSSETIDSGLSANALACGHEPTYIHTYIHIYIYIYIYIHTHIRIHIHAGVWSIFIVWVYTF
jgi:hypothetical protein